MQNTKSIPIHINNAKCIGCGKCVNKCRRGVLTLVSIDMETYINVEFPEACTVCEKCVKACPTNAIEINTNFEMNNDIIKKKKMKRIMKKILHGLLFLAIAAAIIAVVMLLWNALIPQIIGWKAINYWQAAGLLALCKILFGGGFGGRRLHHWRHHRGHMKHKDIHLFRDKMKGMSRDERREFIHQRMRENFECKNPNHSED